MSSELLTVFFDGGCPLCRREIEHYRRLESLQPIQWIDITEPDAPLAAFGLDRDACMRRFHVVDGRGHSHIGARGFVVLWSNLPYYRHLSALIKGLCLLPVLDRVYVRFADWHFGRRCLDGACEVTRGDKGT